MQPIPVTMRSKAWVCSRSFAGISRSNPAWGMEACLLWFFVCFQVEVSATGRSLVQRIPNECGVSESDLGIHQWRGLGPVELSAQSHLMIHFIACRVKTKSDIMGPLWIHVRKFKIILKLRVKKYAAIVSSGLIWLTAMNLIKTDPRNFLASWAIILHRRTLFIVATYQLN
jgi:hypothetical protein